MGSTTLKTGGKRNYMLKQPVRLVSKFAKVAVLATGLSIAAHIANAQSVNNSPSNTNQITFISQKDTTAFGLLYPWLYVQLQEKQGHAIELIFIIGAKISINENPKEKLHIKTGRLHLVLSIKDQQQLKTNSFLVKGDHYLTYYSSCTNYTSVKSFFDRLDIYEIKSK